MADQIRDINDASLSEVLFDSSIGLCLMNKDGIIIRTNKSFCNLLGYNNDELNGFNHFSLLPKENLAQEEQLNAEFWETKEPYIHVVKQLKKDKGYIDLNVNSSITSLNGQEYKLCVVSEVTEMVRLNELMKKVGETTKVGGWERDINSGSIIWTDGIFHIYDLPIGDIPLFNDDRLLDFFEKEDLDRIIEGHNYTINTGKKSVVITKLCSAKGEMKWVKNTSEAIIVNGEIVKLMGTFQDITEEKENELHINESSIRYKYLFDNNPNPMLLVEQFGEYKIVDVNEVAIKMYGYEKNEFIGMSELDLQPKSEEEFYVDNVNEPISFTANHKDSSKTRHLCKSGEVLDVEVYSNNIKLDGKAIKLLLCNDITNNLKQERELVETNSILTTLIETAPIAIVMINKKAEVELWNQKSEVLFGWRRDEVIGKLLPYVPSNKFEELKTNLNDALISAGSYQIEIERENKAGEAVFLREFISHLRDADGNVDKILLLIEDISESKLAQNALIESEIKYRNLVEASNDLIWKLDNKGSISFINKASEKILGYSMNELIGKPFSSFIDEDDFEHWQSICGKVLHGQNFQNFNIQLKNKSGHKVILNSTLYPTFDSDQQISGCSGSAGDITQILQHQKHLETMLKEKEILIKEIHHRVKNNLAVVSGLLSLQASLLDDDEMLSVLSESQSRIQSIATIHEKLYQNELLTSIEIKNYLQQLVQDISDTYASPNKEILAQVIGDEVTLNVNQAVPFGMLANELVINAYKYAFKGKKKGTITLFISNNEGELTFTVSDDGVGLPPKFEINNEKSLGMTLISGLSQQLDASLDIRNMGGAHFTLKFAPDK